MSTVQEHDEVDEGQCTALTKSGDRCRNRVMEGTPHCRVHQIVATDADAPDAARAQYASVAAAAADELNTYAEEVKAESGYQAPPYCTAALAEMLRSNAEKFAAWIPTDLLKEIAQNLEGTKKEDLLDPETWKGLWYLLNYSITSGAKGVLDEAARRLSLIPGMELVVQFAQSVIESPRDLLSIDTWKGAVVILGAAVQSGATSVKRRVTGEEAEA